MKVQMRTLLRCRELRLQTAHAAYRKAMHLHDDAQRRLDQLIVNIDDELSNQDRFQHRMEAAFEEGRATGVAISAIRAEHARIQSRLAAQATAHRAQVSDAVVALNRCRMECGRTERARYRGACLVENLDKEAALRRERLEDAECDEWRAPSLGHAHAN